MKEERKKARRIALSLLARRNYHSLLLCKKLIEKGIEETIARQTVEDLSCYFDDEALLHRTVESELKKGRGPRAISWKLRSKGLSDQVLGPVLKQVVSPEAEREAILNFLLKKKDWNRDRAFSSLMRRGFSSDAISSALQEFHFPR